MRRIVGSQLRDGSHDKIHRESRNLLRAVLEKISLKESRLGCPSMKGLGSIEWLPYELILKIFLLLPAECLRRSCFVCKDWFNLINSCPFIDAHTRQSEPVLLFLKPTSKEKKSFFAIEDMVNPYNVFSLVGPSPCLNSRSYIHFLDLLDGEGKIIESNICGLTSILATCNGLILTTSSLRRDLLVMNPSTRKVTAIPMGTIGFHDESYGFCLYRGAIEYMIVHLFFDEERCISCEMLDIATRSWRAVDGPSSGLFGTLNGNPTALFGVLYWLPGIHGANYLVCLDVVAEKFFKTLLPVRTTGADSLIEIAGCLSYVIFASLQIHVWILKNDPSEDSWSKRHCIYLSNELFIKPLFASRNGRKIVLRGSAFYVYDTENETLEKVMMENRFDGNQCLFVPHVNTLSSW